MQRTVKLSAIILSASLFLAACGQSPAPQASQAQEGPPAVTEPAATLPTTFLSAEDQQALQGQIDEMKRLRDDVRAGKAAAPLNDANQPVDLDAVIAGLDAELQRGKQALPAELSAPVESEATSPGVHETSRPPEPGGGTPYVQSIYTSIALHPRFWPLYNYHKQKYPRFIWSTDGCSVPYMPQFLKNHLRFKPACIQHDFGYRQIHASFYPGLTNEGWRSNVDGKFYTQMRAICAQLNLFLKPACYLDAKIFYEAVRKRGASAFYP